MEAIYEFDAERFRLGSLCKRGHAWPGTNQSLRRLWSRGGCVECERMSARIRNADKELRQQKRQKKNLELRVKGLTVRGTPIKSPIMQAALLANKELRALSIAIKQAGRLPSVAQLVFEAQRKFWTEHPEASAAYVRERHNRHHRWRYMTDHEYRLYHRQKSKRRKALERGGIGLHLKGKQVKARFAEFGHRCAYCGATGDLHIEHVNPISKGGTHVLSNVVPACQSCNYSKRAKDAETWYRAQPFFCKKRWAKILKVMGAGKGSPQQLALL
jgi:5-methylcytosine-specific restriction endonuclease McrA